MRAVIATSDVDLQIALQFSLRREPGVSVVASVSSWDRLLAVTAAAPVDVVIVDDALTGWVADEVSQLRSVNRPHLSVVVLTDDLVDVTDADVTVGKGRPPTDLLVALRDVRAHSTNARRDRRTGG